MYLESLINSLLELFLLIACGFFLRKKEIITEDGVKFLTSFLTAFVLPLNILSSGNGSFDAEIGRNLIICTVIVLIIYAVSIIVCSLLFGYKRRARGGLDASMVTFSNTGFIGLPLASILYGNAGLLYAVIYNLIYNVYFFPLGTVMLGAKNEGSVLKRIFLTPLSMSSILAVVLFLSPVKLPAFINGAMSMCGSMTVPISTMVIGCWMVGLDWNRILKNPESYAVCLMRLVVSPVALHFILKPFSLDPTLHATLVLVTAMPIGSLNVIFSKKANSDVSYVNGTLLLSCALSAITIPALMILLFGV